RADDGEVGLRRVVAVAGDNVAQARSADGVADGPSLQVDAVAFVGQLLRAGNVGPDEVALDAVAGRGAAAELVGNENTIEAVAGDQVAQPDQVAGVAGTGPADDVTRGAIEQVHAVEVRTGRVVGHGLRAGDVGADEVALHEVARSLENDDAGVGV